jgi:SAM-dependent methyltransferase
MFLTSSEQELSRSGEFSVQSLGVPPRRERALDFGCGVGRLTQGLAECFNEIHGVDVSPLMIELARQYNRHNEKCWYHANDFPSLRIFGITILLCNQGMSSDAHITVCGRARSQPLLGAHAEGVA